MQATLCLKNGQTVQAEILPSALDALPWHLTQPQAPVQTAARAGPSVQCADLYNITACCKGGRITTLHTPCPMIVA